MKTTSSTALNLKPLAPTKTKLSPKEELIKQLEAIEAEEALKAQQEAIEAEKKQAARKEQYQALVEEAELNEKLSQEATSSFDKKHYTKEAVDIRLRIKEQFADLMPQPTVIPEVELKAEVQKSFALKQLAVIVGILGIALFGFFGIRDMIASHNAHIAAMGETTGTAYEMAYGIDSFQKIFFWLLVSCIQILAVLGLTFVVNPNIFKYTLSFLKSDPSAQSDFIKLTPWERQKTSAFYTLGFLLYLAILFSGKL